MVWVWAWLEYLDFVDVIVLMTGVRASIFYFLCRVVRTWACGLGLGLEYLDFVDVIFLVTGVGGCTSIFCVCGVRACLFCFSLVCACVRACVRTTTN